MSSIMATEIETRTIVTDPDTFKAALLSAGFRHHATYEQRDIILDVTDGSLFKAGRKIRIRAEGGSAELTYKGPPVGDASASRRLEIDIPVPVSSVEAYIKFFDALGYPVLYQLVKERVKFSKDNVKVTLDTWPIIGVLAELEGPEADIKQCAAKTFPTLIFKNYRLKELFLQVGEQRGMTISQMIEEYESRTNNKLGQLAIALD